MKVVKAQRVPSKFKPDVVASILDLIREGRTVESAAKEHHASGWGFRKFVRSHEPYWEPFEHAKEEGRLVRVSEYLSSLRRVAHGLPNPPGFRTPSVIALIFLLINESKGEYRDVRHVEHAVGLLDREGVYEVKTSDGLFLEP